MYHPLSGFTRIPQVFLYCSCGFFLFLFLLGGGGYKSQTNSEFTLVYGEMSWSDLTLSAQPAHCSHHLLRSLLFPAGKHHSHQVMGVHTQVHPFLGIDCVTDVFISSWTTTVFTHWFYHVLTYILILSAFFMIVLPTIIPRVFFQVYFKVNLLSSRKRKPRVS